MGRLIPPHLNKLTMSGYDFTYDMYIAPYDYRGSAEAFYVYKTHKEQYIKEMAKKWQGMITDKVYNAMMEYEVKIND